VPTVWEPYRLDFSLSTNLVHQSSPDCSNMSFGKLKCPLANFECPNVNYMSAIVPATIPGLKFILKLLLKSTSKGSHNGEPSIVSYSTPKTMQVGL